MGKRINNNINHNNKNEENSNKKIKDDDSEDEKIKVDDSEDEKQSQIVNSITLASTFNEGN
jgi:hypothetical protein